MISWWCWRGQAFRSENQFGGLAFAQRLAAEVDAVGVVNDAVEDGVGQGGIPEHRTMPHRWIGLFLKLRSPIGGIVFTVNALLWIRLDRRAAPTGSGSSWPMAGTGMSAERRPTWSPPRRIGRHCRAFRFGRCSPWHI